MNPVDRQIIISEQQDGDVAANKQLVFALTDEQFERALALYKPAERTKPTLWRNKTFNKNMIKVVAYLESVQYMRQNKKCFSSMIISNHFDNCMIEQFGGKDDDAEFTFSIDEWFNDTRGELPDALANWDPKGHEPMPIVPMHVDWYGQLTRTELQYEGFVDLFANCIDLEEETEREISKRKHGAMTTFGTHPSEYTAMPEPINRQAKFDEFTPSKLLSSSTARFTPSGLL